MKKTAHIGTNDRTPYMRDAEVVREEKSSGGDAGPRRTNHRPPQLRLNVLFPHLPHHFVVLPYPISDWSSAERRGLDDPRGYADEELTDGDGERFQRICKMRSENLNVFIFKNPNLQT